MTKQLQRRAEELRVPAIVVLQDATKSGIECRPCEGPGLSWKHPEPVPQAFWDASARVNSDDDLYGCAICQGGLCADRANRERARASL